MVTVFSFNRHPAYQYLLSHVEAEFLFLGSWEEETRPIPSNITFIQQERIEDALKKADVWLSHLITPDLLEFLKYARQLGPPDRIVQVMHGRVDRTEHVESSLIRPIYSAAKQATKPGLRWLTKRIPIEYVYISPFVAKSWGMPGRIIEPAALTEEITPEAIRSGSPLIVGNDIDRGHFDINLLAQIWQSCDVRVCGRNETVESTYLPWNDLVATYQKALCYLNLLRPPENAFNLATLEAMAGGCPIVTLPHPQSPFVDEENALICKTVDEFEAAIDRLEADEDLRTRLSRASRTLATARFDLERFTTEWGECLQARGEWP